MSQIINPEDLKSRAAFLWNGGIIAVLSRYIAIPNQSPAFDPSWAENGYTDQAVGLIVDWVEGQREYVAGLMVQTLRLPGRTPVILIEISGDPSLGTILMYGHCDKQPPMTEAWREDLHPYEAVQIGDRLYGRGSADDGYSAFAAVTAVRMVQELGGQHGRCVILIEAAEESGSPDLPAYVEQYAELIGSPDLVFCLDSGCSTYDRLWLTTSLRGLVTGDLTVRVLTEGVHSGSAGGIVPSSTILLMKLLSRIMDLETQEVELDGLQIEIPKERTTEAEAVAELLGDRVYKEFPFVEGAAYDPWDINDPAIPLGRLVLYNALAPTLEIIGQSGIPTIGQDKIGNVLRPDTTMRLSVRLPPGIDPATAFELLRTALEADPPYGAEVHFTQVGGFAQGWSAPLLAPWLRASLSAASLEYFGEEMMARGEGGSIPFMKMLGDKFPRAQFVVTGVLGPESNAHGPNEFLHLGYATALTALVAQVVIDHAGREQS